MTFMAGGITPEHMERVGNELEAPASFTSPEILYQDLIKSIRKYHPSDDISMVEKAYRIAYDAHKEQKRKSGEPYIIPVSYTHLDVYKRQLNLQVQKLIIFLKKWLIGGT